MPHLGRQAFFLTPKGPTCVFWQHRNFGHIRVTGDLHTFGNMSQKLWPYMLLFFITWQFGQIFKNHFFQK